MTQQHFTFDAIPAHCHSATSIAAAVAIAPKVGTLRAQVLEYLRERGSLGATDLKQQQALGMNPSTQRPRRIELVKLGLVIDSGRKEKISDRTSAIVWVAK